MMTDGVRPGNTDQAYILRRIIRRAIRSARKISILADGNFCATIAHTIIDQYSDFYTKINHERNQIVDALQKEETVFLRTLSDGEKLFTKVADRSDTKITGIDAFHLYDTYGFPLEITKEMAKERGMIVDEDGFQQCFEEHQAKSRAGAEQKFSGGLADHSDETTKLHTATHLLNAALRQVLGDHVYQKGSNITAERLRFDFSHDAKMTPEQIKQVEDLVNEAIQANTPISYQIMTVDEAKTAGAIGVFDSKYGEKVKVYSMGSFSKEICGGPHVANTAMLGHFKIQKEEASSAGVRRIKAVVSGGPETVEVATESN
jgi:alanyl-tRNA synthetase